MSMYENSRDSSFFLSFNYLKHLVTVKPSSMAHSQMCLCCLLLSNWQDLDSLRWQVAGGACEGVSRRSGKTCFNMAPLHGTGVPGWIETWEIQAEHQHKLLSVSWLQMPCDSCCGGLPTVMDQKPKYTSPSWGCFAQTGNLTDWEKVTNIELTT